MTARKEGPRGIRREELPRVIELVDLVFRPETRSMNEEFRQVFERDDLDNLRTLWQEGRLVSHIAIKPQEFLALGATLRVGSIGGVCTHPDYRGRGYASLLLEDCRRKLRAGGAHFMLISGARGLYLRAGYVKAGLGWHYQLEADRLPRPGGDRFQLRAYRPDDLPALCRLYSSEACHFHRPRAYFETLLASAFRQGASAFVCSSGDQTLAYLVARPAWFQPKEARILSVLDYAGARQALLSACGALFSLQQVNRLELHLPHQDLEFRLLLESRGIEGAPTGMPPGHTMLIINFPGLMEAFSSYVAACLPDPGRIAFLQEGEEAAVRWEGEEVRLGLSDLTRVVLGAEEQVYPREKLPAEGELARALRALFPLPSISVGLNYI
jgi:predicted acetyltransferase